VGGIYNLTGDALRQTYRHERRIEMAFEDQRFWDNKCYFFPIMQNEIEKNYKLIQNPGY
jgi:hypothetical protein